ncbi:MAG: DUF3108 domain-containing protein, partial [Hyphomicrobiaceae bacterium]|nr:DUF3108 domain-containing protein [Hyphomicrobiaceae bacterium]
MKRVVPIVAGLVGFAAGGGGAGFAQAAEWPAVVRASYEVNFNGINVGTFDFQSQAEEESYTLTANARLTLLLGAFTWIGETRAFGLISNHLPKPAAFSFDFNANRRIGSTKVDFESGNVVDVQLSPKPA